MENQTEGPVGNQAQTPPDFQTRPKTWLAESILVTIFCCWPFGIPGIVYAARVDSKFNAGQIEEAKQASEQAGKWTKISFWVAIAGWVIYLLLIFVFGVAGAFWDASY